MSDYVQRHREDDPNRYFHPAEHGDPEGTITGDSKHDAATVGMALAAGLTGLAALPLIAAAEPGQKERIEAKVAHVAKYPPKDIREPNWLKKLKTSHREKLVRQGKMTQEKFDEIETPNPNQEYYDLNPFD